MGGKPAEWEQVKARFAARLADWARVAAEGKLTLCIKPHVGSAAHLPEHALWLLDQVKNPAVGLVSQQGGILTTHATMLLSVEGGRLQ